MLADSACLLSGCGGSVIGPQASPSIKHATAACMYANAHVCLCLSDCLRFVEGDPADPAANRKRDNMLKLIPSVPQGSWIIKQAVGSTPVLLGNKIHTTYYRFVYRPVFLVVCWLKKHSVVLWLLLACIPLPGYILYL